MKRFFLALFALVVFAAAAVVAAPSLIDWNDHRARVAASLASLFGRDVEIAGDLDLSLLPTPILSAGNVQVGRGSPDGVAPLRLSAIEVAVDPLSLLRGEVRVLRAVLMDPEIQVVRQPDGRLHWPIGAGEDARPASPLVTLDRVTVSNGTVSVIDGRGADIVRLTDIFTQFSGDLATGEASLTGSLQAGGVPITMDIVSRAQSSNGSVPVTVSFGIDGLDNELRYAGLLGRVDTGSAVQNLIAGRWDQLRLQGDLSLRGSNLAEALIRLNLIGQSPLLLAQSFGLDARFSARDGQAETSKLSFSLGEVEGTGEFTWNEAESPAAILKAVINRLDMDTVLAAQNAAPVDPAQALEALLTTLETITPGLTDQLAGLPEGELFLSFDRFGAFGDELRHVRLQAQVAADGVQLTGLQATAPGEGDLRLRGNLDWSGAEPAANLDFSLTDAAFTPLAAWLDLVPDAEQGPPISNITLRGSLSGGPGHWQATGIEALLDASRVTGSMAYAASDIPGLGLRLAADRLNLDAYRPTGFDGTTLEWLAAHPLLAPVNAGSPAANVNFDLRADELMADGRRLSGLSIRGTLDQRALRLSELVVDDLSGAALRLSGHYNHTPAADADAAPLDVTGSVITENLGAFADEFSITLPVLPQSPAPADLRARISGDIGGKLKASLSGQLAGTDVNLGGTLDMSGTPSWNGAARLIHPDAGTVFSAYLPGYEPRAASGVFDLFVRLDGQLGDLAVSELIGKVGSAVLAGDGRVRWPTGSRSGPPIIEAALRTGAVDMADWVAQQRSNSFGRWPNRRMSLGWLDAADTDIRLAGRSLTWDGVTLDEPVVSLNTRAGRLEIERFSANGWGGRVGLNGVLTPSETGHEITGRVDVVGVGARRFLGQIVGVSPIDGGLDFGASVQTSGVSIRDWVSQLSGTALVSVREGTLYDMDLAEAAQWVAADEEPVVFLKGLREALGSGETGFQALNARMTINQGRLHTDDFRIAAVETTASGQGSFDLTRWDIELTTDFTMRRLPNAPPLALRLEGPADRPQRRWLTEAVQAYVAQRAARALSDQFIETDPALAPDSPAEVPSASLPPGSLTSGEEPPAEAALPVEQPTVQ